MSNFKVGCSPLTSKLYAGNVLKNGMWGNTKHDVTDSAVSAVAQHLLQLDQRMQFNYKGEEYEIKVVKVSKKKEDNKQCNYCEKEIPTNEGIFICRECSL